MTRFTRRISAILTMFITLLVTAGLLTFSAAPASAVVSTGHGMGHLSNADGFSWLGSYRLADGSFVFCTDVGKQSPIGHDYTFVDAASLGRFSPDDAARLAYIARSGASSGDPDRAAAGQLATWSITGLGGRSEEEYASRANGSAASVLAGARELLTALDGPHGASRSVSASVSLGPVNATGHLRISTSLSVDFLAGGPTVLAAESHDGLLTLEGAVFADGSKQKTVRNGVSYELSVPGAEPAVEVSASVAFDSLPYGAHFLAGTAGDHVQGVLVSRPGSAEGHASTRITVPSSKSFQPRVFTQTSSSVAEAGALISDELVLSAAPSDDPDVLPEWGVYRPAAAPVAGPVTAYPDFVAYSRSATLAPQGPAPSPSATLVPAPEPEPEPEPDENGMLPIPVVVESSLLGPFAEPIQRAEQSPAGAPVVCAVEVLVTAGPGTYRTPECALPGPGYYVWVERISPERTPKEQGGDRILPWQSAFGTASEVTFVAPPTPPAAPPAPPVAAPAAPDAPATLADTGIGSAGGPLPLPLAGSLSVAALLGGALCLRRMTLARGGARPS